MGGGGGRVPLGWPATAASPQITMEIYISDRTHKFQSKTRLDAKANSELYKSKRVCSVVQYTVHYSTLYSIVKVVPRIKYAQGKCGAVGRVADQRSEGSRFHTIVVFLALPLPNSIQRKFTAVVQHSATGRAPRGAARPGTARLRHPAPPPPHLLLRWRNTWSILLQPILFCIFGMCSPWRKSAATVRTVRLLLGTQQYNLKGYWERQRDSVHFGPKDYENLLKKVSEQFFIHIGSES